jgi:hypothetical protein
MATKKLPAAKKSSARSSKSSKKGAKSRIRVDALYREKHPENHRMTGKYKCFYVLFVCTTIFFAALSVWLSVFASDMLNKYEYIEACARSHTRCNVRLEDGGYTVEEAE